jgi:hypothetical protein
VEAITGVEMRLITGASAIRPITNATSPRFPPPPPQKKHQLVRPRRPYRPAGQRGDQQEPEDPVRQDPDEGGVVEREEQSLFARPMTSRSGRSRSPRTTAVAGSGGSPSGPSQIDAREPAPRT